MKTIFIVILLILSSGSQLYAVPSLSLGAATANGRTVSFPVVLSGAQDATIISLKGFLKFNSNSFNVLLNKDAVVSASSGPAALFAGKSLNQSLLNGEVLHFFLWSLNSSILSDGVVATITFDIISPANAGDTFELSSTYSDSFSEIPFSATSKTPIPEVRQVSVAVIGDGVGSINSNPPGIACVSKTCSANFFLNSSVSLFPITSIGSDFFSWSGDCSGQTACTINISTNRSAVAQFTMQHNIKVGNTYFGTLGAAETAAADQAVLRTRDVSFPENVIFDRPIAATLAGGYGSDFATRTGYTAIDGSLAIRAGKLAVDRIKLR